jgi:hypothetical protein
LGFVFQGLNTSITQESKRKMKFIVFAFLLASIIVGNVWMSRAKIQAATFQLNINDNDKQESNEQQSCQDGDNLEFDEDACEISEFSTCEEFLNLYWNKLPSIARAANILNTKEYEDFRFASTRSQLLTSDLPIKLSTSVSYTGRVFIDTTVGKYVQDDSPASKLGNETYYLFGNHEGADWQRFLDRYPRLEKSSLFSCLKLNPSDSALSFGTAKGGTGVPWHFQ